MKKSILVFITALVMGSTFIYAKPLSQEVAFNQSTNVLSVSDQNMIFGEEVKAMPLNNDEMSATQGFGFWSSIGDFFKENWGYVVGGGTALAGCAVFAPACSVVLGISAL